MDDVKTGNFCKTQEIRLTKRIVSVLHRLITIREFLGTYGQNRWKRVALSDFVDIILTPR